MSEQIESISKLYPEQEAEIRLVIKVKQTSNGGLSGYVYNFEFNNYEGLIQNATQLARQFEFQYATDKMIEVTIDNIRKNRSTNWPTESSSPFVGDR
jgi:ferritin-like metal-binding protein YciE